MSIQLTINGFTYDTQFPQQETEEIWVPFLRQIDELYKHTGKRVLVFLVAAPGTGKSTLVAYLEYLAKSMENLAPLQAIGMDGFHYPNSYLDTHEFNGKSLRSIKGAPETFDVDGLSQSIQQLKSQDTVLWPIYDRNLHDVVKDAISVNAPLVLLEGNYLLLDEEGWRDLHLMADMTIFIGIDPSLVRERLIQRKVKGGSSLEAATAFFENSDGKNVERVLHHSLPADLQLLQDSQYHYQKM